MSTGGPIPSTDAEFNDYVNDAHVYFNTSGNSPRIISGANLVAYNLKIGAWRGPSGNNGVYAKSQNPATRTETTIQDKANLRKEIEDLLRDIFADIPNSVLTTTDRSTLHLPARDEEPSPVPAPNHGPLALIDKIDHLLHKIRFRDPQNPNTKAKPQGVVLIMCEQIIVNGGQEADERNISTTGKFLHTFNYVEAQVTKTVKFRARYLNGKGEAGPWGPYVQTQVVTIS